MNEPATAVAVEPVREASLAVRTTGLGVRAGGVDALSDVDLEILPGEVVLVEGPNDGGPATLLAVLAGACRPSSGKAYVFGRQVARPSLAMRRSVGYVTASAGFDPRTTVVEDLRFAATLYGVARIQRKAVVDDLLELVDLAHHRGAWADNLSASQRQRLRLARALVHDPGLLLLDEPLVDLDRRSREDLAGLVHELGAVGKAVLIAVDDPASVEALSPIATRSVVMEHGRIPLGEPSSWPDAGLPAEALPAEVLPDGGLPDEGLPDDGLPAGGLAGAEVGG